MCVLESKEIVRDRQEDGSLLYQEALLRVSESMPALSMVC